MASPTTRIRTERPARPVPSARPPQVGRLFEPPAWEWSAAEDVGWWVRPAWRNTLLRDGRLRLDEWEARGLVSTIKSGPHRTVWRVALPEGAIYIKHFLVPDLRSVFRQWFRRGKGRNEAKRAARLAAFGVTTIAPVALGERRKRGFLFDNYLISPEIPGAVPLDQFVARQLAAMPPERRKQTRRELARALGELTARLHEGGFLHNDFHPGNVLVRLDERGHPHLAMIDLDALRSPRVLGRREAMNNLALLNHYFWTRSSRVDRVRFLRAYLASRSGSVGDPASFARGIESATRAWAERLWRRWGKRCLGTNKYFQTIRQGTTRCVASREIRSEDLARLLDDPDAPFQSSGAVILKDSRTTTVAEIVLPVGGANVPVIYKRFNRKKLLDPLLTLLRPSRAWRAWQNGQHLASRGIPTPQNLAVILRSKPGPRALPYRLLPHETYLLTRKAEPAITLGKYTAEVLPTLPPDVVRSQIRSLTPALARLIRQLHERSLSHRDLKAANILIEGDPMAPVPRLSLIDLVGVALETPPSHHRRIQNLARLQISLAHVHGRTRTDSLRFLRAYEPRSRIDPASWKRLWREVEEACRRKERQNLRRNRRLS
jgi:tRNA A-37 threonylcarbamoyl transferase component Bud32